MDPRPAPARQTHEKPHGRCISERGGEWRAGRPGLRPANLDGKREPRGIRQVLRLATPPSVLNGVTYGCGSAPESDRLPLRCSDTY